MRQAAIYDPYLDSLGGGERYALSLVPVLKEMDFNVDLIWSGQGILKDATKRFGLNLVGLNVEKDFFRGRSLLSKWRSMSKYDFIFFVSDGSVPFLAGKINWLHFQVPFRNVDGGSSANKIKLSRIKRVVVNSQFTKKVIDREYGVVGDVLYPPVATDLIRQLKKEKIILSVGRFSKLLQSKRHDFLIKTFKELVDGGLKGWTLALVGGLGGMSQRELEQLRNSARGYPIKFIFEPDFSELVRLYGRSSIFWTASGYGEDEASHPEKVEHFGVTLVEAMAAGCVVLPVKKGGFKEIMGKEFNDLVWETPEELKRKTKEVIASLPGSMKNTRKPLRQRALEFSYEKFKMGVKRRLDDDFSE